MKHLLKDANGVGNYTPYVDYSGSTITFQNTIWNKVKRNLVLWYDLKRQGATNENMANSPILKYLSGNGHDATCYNFAWSGMSGIGGYHTDYKVGYTTPSNRGTLTYSSTKINITNVLNANNLIETSHTGNILLVPSYNIKVVGLPQGAILRYKYYIDENDSFYNITEDGNYTLPESTYNHYYVGFGVRNFTGDCNIVIEQIPEYPNALVSDGVDDYCRVGGLPILTDYTVIAKRKWIKTEYDTFATFSSKSDSTTNGEFIFERFNLNGNPEVYSFGVTSTVTLAEDITYQTPTSYNGRTINKGNFLGNDRLSLFALRGVSQFSNIALYSFVLFNRTLTEDEIKKWVRENMDENYLLPNERPEPIIYYDFRNGDNSNLSTVTDLSGNERHGTMYNFTGEANSGYSDGCLKFNGTDNYIKIPYSDDAVYKTVILLVRVNRSTSGIIYDGRYGTGLTTGIALFYGNGTSDFLSERLSDNAKLYVNGVTNTSYTNADMKGKKCCVAVSDDVLYSGNLGGPPNIGTVRFASNWFSGMELYAFLGFDKILTEEEIRYVMNKYNLLEGIDEI